MVAATLRRSALSRIAALACSALGAASVSAAQPCPFDHQQLAFVGTPAAQAHCLLRHVRPYGELDPPLEQLPDPLERLVGRAVSIASAAFEAYLAAQGIDSRDVGGPLSAAVSHAKAGDAAAPVAAYFVIHDTSTPALGNAEFPADIDLPGWSENQLGHWLEGERSRAHVFIGRTGASVTPVDFSEPWRATKFEMQDTLLRRKGLFLHIELVQPRRNDPQGPEANEAQAPVPGFTQAQYQRLAVVYVAASLRRGQWLVPAFHAVLDAGRVDAHDDPQNFDVAEFARALTAVLAAIERPTARQAVAGIAENRPAVAPARIPE